MIAADKSLKDVVYELLSYNGININACDKFGKNALFYAIEGSNPNTEIIKTLLERGINVNCEAKDKSTPILKAIEKDYSKIVEELIQKQASLYCTNEYGGKFST